MEKILIFAGTTEGRILSEHLSFSGIEHVICVAGEYGRLVLNENPLARVHTGRMNTEEMRELILKNDFKAVVDMTHPFAVEVTKNIRTALENTDIPYIRLKREESKEADRGDIHYFKDSAECAAALENTEGNILLTTGSKELYVFCKNEEVKKRLYVRVLPSVESIELCMAQGIEGRQIIAAQGIFSAKMNEATIKQYEIKCLVTKESGKNGGFSEKAAAAEEAEIPLFVIGRPSEEGSSFDEVLNEIGSILKKDICRKKQYEIVLTGIGMGDRDSLTIGAERSVREADIILGSERCISDYEPKIEKKAFYKAEDIVPYLKKLQESAWTKEILKVAVLFSGDSGFYSGCRPVYNALMEEIKAGRLKAKLKVLPGISSASYLSACLGESYNDACVYSLHGREHSDILNKIRREKKTFLLMSGLKDMHRLGELLDENGINCKVVAGFQLSYPNQRIMELSPKECKLLDEEGLFTCLVYNPDYVLNPRFPQEVKKGYAMSDDEFIRGEAPMTKEEIRHISISRLRLHDNAVLYDVGSGTGSVAIEAAGLSENIRVYAIEQRKEAISLIEKNMVKAGRSNIEIIHMEAPKAFSGLTAPTHAFIGGSGGKMKEIIAALYDLNPKMRIVINAVSLETISEIQGLLSAYPVKNEDIVQIQVSRAKPAGRYHLMQAENPVWICSFEFDI